jgi:hypothetical protein
VTTENCYDKKMHDAMQQMSVNDMFLDEDGIEGSKVKYYQHTDVVDKVEVQNSS